jgi:cation transport protein ChaC
MWVFGYGSLMCDGWETEFRCPLREIAELPGYQRVFNKASTWNWGTKEGPGPTLNLEAVPEAKCVGVAFEFDDSEYDAVREYLRSREGSGFELREDIEVKLEDGRSERALVPICTNEALLIRKSLSERARLARAAKGKKGACVAYVEDIVEALSTIRVKDPIVTEFWAAISASP